MSDLEGLLSQADRARLGDRPDEARTLLGEAAESARGSGDWDGLGRALAKLGQIERDCGRIEPALEYYREAAAIARDGDDSRILAHRLRHIADIHLDSGRLDLAEPFYDEALAIYGASDDVRPLDLANALRPMAELREKQGRAAEAIELFGRARTLYEQEGVEAGAEQCARRIESLQG